MFLYKTIGEVGTLFVNKYDGERKALTHHLCLNSAQLEPTQSVTCN